MTLFVDVTWARLEEGVGGGGGDGQLSSAGISVDFLVLERGEEEGRVRVQLSNNQGGVLLCQAVVGDPTLTQVSLTPPASPPSSPRAGSPCSEKNTPGCERISPLHSLPSSPVVLTENTPTQCLQLSAVTARAFTTLLRFSQAYSFLVHSHWLKLISGQRPTSLAAECLLRLEVTKDPCGQMDLWSFRLFNKVLWVYIELEDALHWLSTLGGAYSNLGEHSTDFAVRAGKNALKQLVVAQKFGDKTTVAKCWLFVGMSEMQLGHLSRARTIIRNIFSLCQTPAMRELTGTEKIVTICRGIWARLKYEIEKSKSYRHNDRMRGEKIMLKSKMAASSLGSKMAAISLETKSAPIEVECKFDVPAGCRDLLSSSGGHLVAVTSFEDKYFDRKNFELVKKDFWLRQRNDAWELKYPEITSCHNLNTTYREETAVSVIMDLVGHDFPPASDSGWIVLVHFNTTRETWRLPGEGVEIVLDRLEDGFTIGEIEKVVYSPEEVPAAEGVIQELAARLGFKRQRGGKVDYCLQKQNPEALEIVLRRYAQQIQSNPDQHHIQTSQE